jgi:MoaA/NifB/PqqE/SkfB family radical SAM enzyme
MERRTAIPSDPPPAPSAVPAGPRFPSQPLLALDSLWVQVGGTLCNLSCTHCFVSCGPGDDHHALMSRQEVRARVAEGLALGVKDIYFTGGEPFLHPELLDILDDTLSVAPATVLTNGTLMTDRRIAALVALAERSRFTLEIRVSLDGATAAEHDLIRGAGNFDRAMDGLRRMAVAGLLPIVTVTDFGTLDPIALRERYLEVLRDAGLSRPRLKVLPMFQLGREVERSRGYAPTESLAGLAPEQFDRERLQCGRCRAVTSQGVFVCPLLVDEPGGRMGASLAEANRPFELRHGACLTCYVTGMTCGNG